MSAERLLTVRGVTLVLGIAWALLMSLAVVSALWHAPFDAVGSILLAVASSLRALRSSSRLGPGDLHECEGARSGQR